MAFTTEQLNALEAAIATGSKRVKYADKEVEYQSLDDMLRLRDLMQSELGQKPKTKRFFANFSKGTAYNGNNTEH
jgi:hypothetical protein